MMTDKDYNMITVIGSGHWPVNAEVLLVKTGSVVACMCGCFNLKDDVCSLSLPGTYHEKIGCLGNSLKHFTRLKSLDLSRNALENLAVSCWH